MVSLNRIRLRYMLLDNILAGNTRYSDVQTINLPHHCYYILTKQAIGRHVVLSMVWHSILITCLAIVYRHVATSVPFSE